jgi:hypothetical protein
MKQALLDIAFNLSILPVLYGSATELMTSLTWS